MKRIVSLSILFIVILIMIINNGCQNIYGERKRQRIRLTPELIAEQDNTATINKRKDKTKEHSLRLTNEKIMAYFVIDKQKRLIQDTDLLIKRLRQRNLKNNIKR